MPNCIDILVVAVCVSQIEIRFFFSDCGDAVGDNEKKEDDVSSSFFICAIALLLFGRSLSGSLGGLGRSFRSGGSTHRSGRSLGLEIGRHHVLNGALRGAFFGVFRKSDARNQAEHDQDASHRPSGFFEEIGRLTDTHHLVGTTEIGHQTATF